MTTSVQSSFPKTSPVGPLADEFDLSEIKKVSQVIFSFVNDRCQLHLLHRTLRKPRVLLIGLDAAHPAIEGKLPMSVEQFNKFLQDAILSCKEAGFDAESYLFLEEDGLPGTKAKLRESKWDAVCIGFGTL